MLKTFLKSFTIFIGCLFLISCASTGNQKLAKMDNAQTNRMIVNGKTTQTQVKTALGEPNNVSYTSDGNEIWSYSYTKSKSKAINFVPYLNLVTNGTNDRHKKIVILFDSHNVVKRHSFTESKGETKGGLIA